MREASEWVQRLSDPAVDEQAFFEWEQWCGAHPANAAFFQQMQEVWDGFASSRIARVQHAAPNRRWPLSLAAAAMLLIAVTAAFFIQERLPSRQELITNIGEIRRERLADGSQLDLGADSVVRLEYSNEQRDVQLVKGRAFFAVERDPARPFVVRAGGLEITAVGTQFDVRIGVDSAMVTVGEGRVKVIAANSQGFSEPRFLDAGQRVSYSKTADTVVMMKIEPQLTESWRQGILQFQEEPLREVVNEINRYTQRPVLIGDDALGATAFTGTISPERLDDWFIALEKILPVDVKDQGVRGIVIESRIDTRAEQ